MEETSQLSVSHMNKFMSLHCKVDNGFSMSKTSDYLLSLIKLYPICIKDSLFS